MGNPYFNHTYDKNNNEALLYKNATDEICEMNGIDFKYISKTLVKPDYIFGEDTLKEFNKKRTITFYIENYENFDGVDDMFGKFGFEVENRLILIIERDRFKLGAQKDPEVDSIIDDLIYHPNSGKLFRVVHIDVNENFYQMNGGQDRYKITCELHIPSHEDYDTEILDVDEIGSMDDSNNTLEQDEFDNELNSVLNLDESDIFENL